MENCLDIADLNHCEYLEGATISGANVYVNAYTSAEDDSALAYVEVSAFGQHTFTDANTLVTVKKFSSASFSYAQADATATAVAEDGIVENATYKSTSIYYSGY